MPIWIDYFDGLGPKEMSKGYWKTWNQRVKMVGALKILKSKCPSTRIFFYS